MLGSPDGAMLLCVLVTKSLILPPICEGIKKIITSLSKEIIADEVTEKVRNYLRKGTLVLSTP